MPSKAPSSLTIHKRGLEDLAPIRELMFRTYPPPTHGPEAVWSERNLLSHLARFPEGQFVAEVDGILVGTSTCMRVRLERALTPHTWTEITARGTLATHDPVGNALYGVNIAVEPALQGLGIGHALYRARIALAQSLGCRWFVAGARIPGYHQHAAQLSPEAYLQAVREGRVFDPTLSRQMKVGFEVRGLLMDYAPDPETQGHAALIIMEL